METNAQRVETQRTFSEKALGDYWTLGTRGLINPQNRSQTSRTVNTNWIGEAEMDWLTSLFTSTDVYEINSAGETLPVIIKGVDRREYVKRDKLALAEFTYTLAWNTIITQ